MAPAVIKTLGAGVLLQALAIGALAAEIPPPAYQLAAYQAGIPSEVLYSVALQESGTRLRGKGSQLVPWPWTLNVAGAGYRFATRADACTALLVALNAPGLQPFFLVGGDELSRQWLARRGDTLQRLGAVGLVVNVTSAERLAVIRRWTGGVAVSPVVGDDLAARLGLAYYPVLITATALEQQEPTCPASNPPT